MKPPAGFRKKKHPMNRSIINNAGIINASHEPTSQKTTLQSHLKNAHSTMQHATQPLGKAFSNFGLGLERAAKTAVEAAKNAGASAPASATEEEPTDTSLPHVLGGGNHGKKHNAILRRKSKGSNRTKILDLEELPSLKQPFPPNGELGGGGGGDADTKMTEYEGNVNAIKFNAYDFHITKEKDLEDNNFFKYCESSVFLLFCF